MIIRPPQFTPPPPGQTLDQHFEVILEAPPAGACVSIVQGRATILIARRILEQVSAVTPERWTTEQERLARIQGSRARALLQQVTSSLDAFGCAPVQPAPPGDALYLVGDLLQAGQVAVVDNETHQHVGHIVVHFSGMRAGELAGMGSVSYAFAKRSAPFLRLSWWVS